MDPVVLLHRTSASVDAIYEKIMMEEEPFQVNNDASQESLAGNACWMIRTPEVISHISTHQRDDDDDDDIAFI